MRSSLDTVPLDPAYPRASITPEVLEARQELAVMEAAAAVLEEKLAAASLESSAAREAQARAEERVSALEQETAWLQQRLVSLQAEGDGEAQETQTQLSALRKEVALLRAERDSATSAVKGQMAELRVGASAVGAKIALTEQLERMKASIAPLQAALEAERAWSKEMEAQLEGEKTAKLALAAKSSAMVKALRSQLDDVKAQAVTLRSGAATPVEAHGAAAASYSAEAEAKAALEERKALAREVAFLKERSKALGDQLEKERSAARDRELRLRGKYDAMLERSQGEAEGTAVAALQAQVSELQQALEASFEREAQLSARR
jgi:chromosome segregation ATPase